MLGGGALLLGFMRQYHDLRTGLLWGAIGLVAGLLLLLAYIGINFESFFTNFHQVFFASGTWTFEYTDTLIRLFPIQFWADVSVLVVATALAQGALLCGLQPAGLGSCRPAGRLLRAVFCEALRVSQCQRHYIRGRQRAQAAAGALALAEARAAVRAVRGRRPQ